MRLKKYSHRWATEVLANPEYSNLEGEIFDVLQRLPLIACGEQPWSQLPPNPPREYPVDQAVVQLLLLYL